MGSSNSTPGHLSEEKSPVSRKDVCTFIFVVALLAIAKIWKQPVSPIHE